MAVPRVNFRRICDTFLKCEKREKTKWTWKRACFVAFMYYNITYVIDVRMYPGYVMVGDTDTGSLKSITRQNLTGEVCPLYPESLAGKILVIIPEDPPTEVDIVSKSLPLLPGGGWAPTECVSMQTVAIIIPYRNRADHLKHLLNYLHPLLQSQLREYRIFVVEQAYDDIFNKGRIMNIAFEEVIRYQKYDCVIFHDVDMIPENDRNLYMCADQPRHLSPALDEMRYTLMYDSLAGGVLALTPGQFTSVNGFSNIYWGWGAEDDDMSYRLTAAGFKVTRPTHHVGRYKMIRHQKRPYASNRRDVLAKWERWPHEGLNDMPGLNTRIISKDNLSLYTHILVDIGPSPKQDNS